MNQNQLGLPQNDRAFQARQNNTIEIINQLVKKNQENHTNETIQPIEQTGISQQQNYLPMNEIKARIDVDAFDENGNFKKPPVKGYWLGMLEKINFADPYKQGRDWRDETIETFKATHAILDEIEASIR